ncbi:MAG: hypothetical protein NT142_12645 [Planctomycetota bacterium]|nr:hypothetical protein [Planctomycetota bacterium]
MQNLLRLALVLLAASVFAAILPLGLIAWDHPGRFLVTIQRELKDGSTEYLLILCLFLVPSVANAWLGYSFVSGKGWGLVPLCLIVPVWAWVTSIDEAKGPIVILLSLVPSGVCWLSGRLGQRFRMKNPPSKTQSDNGAPETAG